jgi:hydrogenase-4 component F
MPGTGPLFAAGVLALMGLPPFGLFVSEFLLFRAGFVTGHVAVTAVALLLVGIGFVALASHLLRMLFGEAPPSVAAGESDRWALVPVIACVAALVALGLYLPGPVASLIARIVENLAT